MTPWEEWAPQDRAVLVFLIDGDRVLLVRKKRGLGAGKIGGPGGKLEVGETWEQAARRETREETGLTVAHLERAAHLRFQFTDGYSLEVVAFGGSGWSGDLASCDETDPFWHPKDQIPWDSLWADDGLWLPPLLKGRCIEAKFLFEGDAMHEAWVEISPRPEPPNNG